MKDVFSFLGILGCCIGAAVLTFLVIDHIKARRPYLAARWDDAAGDWLDEEPHDVGPADPRLPAGINRLLDDYAALDPDLRHVFGPTAPHHTTEEGQL